MPSIRQKRTMQKLVENGGKSISAAMREGGYSPATAENPSKLTTTKGWKELVEEYLSNDLLLKVHLEGLGATRIQTSPTEGDKVVPDFGVRHKYLETGYKISGKLDQAQSNITVNVIPIYGGMSVNVQGHESDSTDIQTQKED